MLNVDNIHCQFDNQPVLEEVSFAVSDGDICCLLGPSGCGKTTALRAIAGFQPLSAGQISLAGQLLSRPGFCVEPEQRHIGMVFQDYALFPHLTVRDNIRFGIRRQTHSEQRRTIDELLALVKLDAIDKRYPYELSGGQQQRVALARALAPNPRLLLLDEPFSNLDVDLRRHLNLEIRDILKQCGISAILVTHDQQEAFAFADYIGLLNNGKLQQWGTAFKLYHEPCNRFVARFIGNGCWLPGQALGAATVKTEFGIIGTERNAPWRAGTPLDILLRSDDIVPDNRRGIPAEITDKVFSGSATLYTLRLPSGHTVESLMANNHDYMPGQTIKVSANIKHLIASTTSG